MSNPDPWTIHYTELKPFPPGEPLAVEWSTYLREVSRLLAEGQEGRWVLIKGEEIIGIYDTHDEAAGQGYDRYLRQGFLIHQIQERERVIRFMGFFRPYGLKRLLEDASRNAADRA
jgi:hypothetical protein